MEGIARIPLDGGGSVLIEAAPEFDGPVKAGRISDAIRDLPVSLAAALEPVTDMTRTVLRQLRRASPDEIEVEFGVNLAAHAGAVIAKSEANCHLRVKVVWKGDESAPDTPESQ
ncbi:CU044_2847 family protein [Streptomyces sp. NPDC001851]|uniref:CU044_2847 family protein n=1 Tax=Streptomyces sp. NPDC001851 TaxID=3154529 RepID=UPI00332A8B14